MLFDHRRDQRQSDSYCQHHRSTDVAEIPKWKHFVALCRDSEMTR